MCSEKTCFKCLKTLPIDAFYRHSKMGDGRLGKCKECTKSDSIQNRLKNIDKYRQYDKMRASMPHRKELAKRVNESWKSNYPNRRAANIALGNAVRSGKIKRLPCFVCGERAVAHHPDYERPLDVVWLCQAHHKQAHALVKS